MREYITGTELSWLNLLRNVQVQTRKLNSIRVLPEFLFVHMLIKLKVL